MAQNVSDFLIDRLKCWGIHRIYGYPGDGINGIMGALERAENDPRFIQVRHEEMAAFMACAHGKFTGEVGVCLATSGPGAIHLLNGLYDARMDHSPVLAIVGQQARSALGSFYQQEVDLVALFKDVASDYVLQLSDPEQVRHAVDCAMRIAMAKKTVTCLIFPHDLQEEKAVESPPRVHGTTFSGVGYSQPRIVPEERDLRRAAEILNDGQRVAMLIGAGALQASDAVIETAEILGAGVAKALLGKGALPDHLPFVTGSIGLLGTEPTWKMMQDCDTLLMVGSGFPYSEFLPKEGRARGVQIDIESRMLNLRYPMEVALHGDSRLTLEALLPMLRRKEDRSWRKKIEEWMKNWWEILEARAMNSANPINPQRVFWELSPRMPDNSILCADSGSTTSWWARDLKIRPGMMASVSGTLATMGSACPYAVAAKFAFPERSVIATAGDGAMQMNGNNVLITVEKYWREWANKQLLFVVINNHDLNMVTWEERILAGDPKFEASQTLPDFPYAEYAKTLGLGGLRGDRPDDIVAALEEGLAADRPTLLEFVCDPEVPPLPPHISLEQATNFMKSVAKGDKDRWRMIKQSVKEMVENVVPHKEHAHRGEE